MGRLDGKVALITGAARGQGRSHAVTLAAEGAQIVATDICEQVTSVPYAMSTQEDLDETMRLVEALDQRCLAIKADARDSKQMDAAVARAVAEFGRIDILCVNHGIAHPVTWDQVSDELWNDTIETDLSAVWFTIRPVIPHMIEQGGGSIVLISSVAGIRAFYGLIAYVAAKHGVIGLTRALAAELAPHWIRVNAICPTNVATPMLHNPHIAEMFSGVPGAGVEDMVFAAKSTNLLPIPWIEPKDISNGVLYLASDDARYITGIAMPIDAGMSNQPSGIPVEVTDLIAELSDTEAGGW